MKRTLVIIAAVCALCAAWMAGCATGTKTPEAHEKAVTEAPVARETEQPVATQAFEPTPAPEPIDYQAVYREFVTETLLPGYGLADMELIQEFMSDDYWDDMSGAAGLVSVHIADMDSDGADDLLALIVGDDGESLYMHLYTYADGAVQEITESAGVFLPAIDRLPEVLVNIYHVTAGDESYLFCRQSVSDADTSEYFLVFGVRDGAVECLLDVVYHNNTGNGTDSYVICRTGPGELMATNRKTGVGNISRLSEFSSISDPDAFYAEGVLLMFFKCYDDEYESLVVHVNDLYADELAAVSGALSYFGVACTVKDYDMVFTGVNGTELVPLITGYNHLNDHTGLREWFGEL